MNSRLKESVEQTVYRVNTTHIAAQDMIDACEYSSGGKQRRTLIELSNHLLYDLEFDKKKTEAILLRTVALVRSIESGIPGTSWGAEGAPSLIPDAIVAAAASARLLLVEGTIRFDASELLNVGLRHSEPMGFA